MKTRSVRVKMCGMTRIDDIQHAVQLGVNAIGLVFYDQSTRGVSIEKARVLVQNIPPFVDVVAVLVNPDQQYVSELLTQVPVDLLQFHGDESSDFCEQFKKSYIKALHLGCPDHLEDRIQQYSGARAILLDSVSDTKRGGTGETLDWDRIPGRLSKPLILAGGLNDSNVHRALSACQPFAVDVCTGVEQSPGVKDPEKMQRFMNVIWSSS